MGLFDPYRVLGLDARATRRDIRRAYHTLALRHHPDAGGEAGGERFVEIHEAYELLSDPAARADYDRARAGYADRRHQLQFSTETSAPASYSARRRERELGSRVTVSPFDLAGSLLRGALDEIDLLAQGFVHEGVGHRGDGALHYDLSLSAEEAARGGQFSFRVPIRRRCFGCSFVDRWACRACGGEGYVVDEPAIDVLVPPGVQPGQRAALSLERLGVGGGVVDVTVRID